MLPASLAAWVPVFIATPTSAWASAGASFVPSPVIATSAPPACSRLISAILSSGVASARKSSTPASSAIAFAVSGLSPVIITVRIPIARSSAKRSLMPSLTTSLRWTTPSARPFSATTSGVPPEEAIPSTAAPSSAGMLPPCSSTQRRIASAAPLRMLRPSHLDAAHARLRRERDELGAVQLAAAEAVALLREHDDRAALGRLVGEARELGRIGELLLGDARGRDEVGCLPVAERDRAGLVEQQRRAVARGFDGAAAHARARCAARADPCRRCRSRRAARRSSSG